MSRRIRPGIIRPLHAIFRFCGVIGKQHTEHVCSMAILPLCCILKHLLKGDFTVNFTLVLICFFNTLSGLLEI